MKYMRHLSLSLACVIAGALSAHSVQANVIPDASFENGTWRLQDNTMSIVDSPVRSGKKAFKIVNTGNGYPLSLVPIRRRKRQAGLVDGAFSGVVRTDSNGHIGYWLRVKDYVERVGSSCF